MDEAIKIRVVVFQDGEDWVAQCLEYDICTHAKNEDVLRSRFIALYNLERNLSIERNGAPFEGIDPAPVEFHEMWGRCKEIDTMTHAGTHLALAKCA